MCGRFLISDDSGVAEIQAILSDIDAKYCGTEIFAKTGEVAPTNIAPVLALSGGKPTLCLMRWGFPRWKNKGVVINARAESAAEKPMFAKPYAERRCVIPSTGFFEWRRDEHGKPMEKLLFNASDTQMLYMAAVYEIYDCDAPLKERFVILTREANDSMREIHDRMPVVLHKKELTQWLTNKAFADNVLLRGDIELRKQAQF